VEKKQIPAGNRKTIPPSSSPQPSHYTIYAFPAPNRKHLKYFDKFKQIAPHLPLQPKVKTHRHFFSTRRNLFLTEECLSFQIHTQQENQTSGISYFEVTDANNTSFKHRRIGKKKKKNCK
jgi:hypothetical protein